MAVLAQVIDTIELLGAILARVPNYDLLLAQCVSRKWQTVISQSPKLQQKLFFRAGATQPLKFRYESQALEAPPVTGPFYDGASRFAPPDGIRKDACRQLWTTHEGSKEGHEVEMNPLLWRILAPNFNDQLRYCQYMVEMPILEIPKPWMSMFITSPAISEIRCAIMYHHGGGWDGLRTTISASVGNGLTLLDLIVGLRVALWRDLKIVADVNWPYYVDIHGSELWVQQSS